jgi:glutamate decarboxylase
LQKQILRADEEKQIRINEKLNEINRTVQRLQREAGNSFVSRTTLKMKNCLEQDKVVLRAVIMNPMTTIDILRNILDEQEKIYKSAFT